MNSMEAKRASANSTHPYQIPLVSPVTSSALIIKFCEIHGLLVVHDGVPTVSVVYATSYPASKIIASEKNKTAARIF